MSKKTLILLSMIGAFSLAGCSASNNGVGTPSNIVPMETQIAGADTTTAAETYEHASFILLDSVTVKPEGANPYISFKALLKNEDNSDWICPDMLQVVGNSNPSSKYPIQLGEIIYSNEDLAFVRGIANSEDLENIKYAWKNGMEVTPITGTTEDKMSLVEYGIYPMADNYYSTGPAVIMPGITDAALWESQGTTRSFLVSLTPASAMDMVMYDADVKLLDAEKNDVTALFGADRIEYQGGTSFIAVYESEEAKQNLPTMESFPDMLASVKYIEWHLDDGTAVTAPVNLNIVSPETTESTTETELTNS